MEENEQKENLEFKKSNFEKIKREEIKGIENIVKTADEFICYLKNYEEFHNYGAKIPQGAIFVGPRGTGKTTISKYIASGSDALFINLDEYVGKKIVEIYDAARAHVKDKEKPIILFQDEFDKKLLNDTNNGDFRASEYHNLLKTLDGIEGDSINEGVFFIGTANKITADKEVALFRPGRLEMFHLYPPNESTRKELLDLYLNKSYNNDRKNIDIGGVDTACLASIFSDKDTPATIKSIVKEAYFNSVKRKIQGESKDTISLETNDLFSIIANRRMRERKETDDYGNDEETATTSIHELGHYLVARECGIKVPYLTIVPSIKSLGTTYLPDVKKVYTYGDALDLAAVACGGYLAEEKMGFDPSLGASGDIRYVEALAKIINEHKKFKSSENGYTDIPQLRDYLKKIKEVKDPVYSELAKLDLLLGSESRDYAHEFIENAKTKAKDSLGKYSVELIECLSEEFKERKTYFGKDLEKIIKAQK